MERAGCAPWSINDLADIHGPFESLVPAVRHKVRSGATVEEHLKETKRCDFERHLLAFVSESLNSLKKCNQELKIFVL